MNTPGTKCCAWEEHIGSVMTGRRGEFITTRGQYRRKYHLRAIFQSGALLGLIALFSLSNYYHSESSSLVSHGLRREEEFSKLGPAESSRRLQQESSLSTAAESTPFSEGISKTHLYQAKAYNDYGHHYPVFENGNDRSLQEEKTCDQLRKAEPTWFLLWFIIGVLYMFLALAIVCDEFFVPALEELSGPRRLNLSMDVAGATFMAAGGSAPELFSSFFGTFQESEIGFGTIIGSAVFNVLFVIAMCSFFTKDVLNLTWWPLFRDSFCYAIGLIILSVFTGVTTPKQIVLWESIVLFLLYIVYIIIMWKNANIYKLLTGKKLENPEEAEAQAEAETDAITNDERGSGLGTGTSNDGEANIEVSLTDSGDLFQEKEHALTTDNGEEKAPERPNVKVTGESSHSLSSKRSVNSVNNILQPQSASTIDFRWQGTFRAGILKLLRDPHTWLEMGGIGIVAKIAGDADQVFKQVDANGDGTIDKEELKQLFEMLECRMTCKELDEVFAQLDENGNGTICKTEFDKWYMTSAELIRSQMRSVFDSLDTDSSNSLDKFEIKELLRELDPAVTDETCKAAIETMYKDGSRDEVTFEEFEEWFETSMIYEQQKQAVEEDMQGVWESLKPPKGKGCGAWIRYIVVLPLVVVLVFTIPDVQRPGWNRWCYFSFVASIVWIGVFSFFMVNWAETIGNTLGIPSVIMGLTVLAAGTSVPDLLSSVIVAKRGLGDMAVSSSIGSNIFDILVGLPVPWFFYSAIKGRPVGIGTDGLMRNVLILLGMLVFVIAAVHCQGWKLSRSLGVLMMLFYFGFLVQAIVLLLPFQICVNP